MATPGPSNPNKGKGRARDVPIEVGNQDPCPPPHGFTLPGIGADFPAPNIDAKPPGPFHELKSLVPLSVASAADLGSPRAISMRLKLMNVRALEVAVLSKNLSALTKCLENKPPEGLTLLEVKSMLGELERLDSVMQDLNDEAIKTSIALNMAFRARFQPSTVQYVNPRDLTRGGFGGSGNAAAVDTNMTDFISNLQQLVDETMY
ncbi:hypothetical protein IQ07DRAFT_606110 [Pyrenochaeta sp. DS3sAY3a]|nr:hypothetical protein IQ07DRAFT_606110 [Pyrenochaeta sp. DS3sAY3a]